MDRIKASLAMGVVGLMVFMFCIFLAAVMPQYLVDKVSPQNISFGQLIVTFIGMMIFILGFLEK